MLRLFIVLRTAFKLTLVAAWWGACFAGYVALRYWL